VRHIFLSQDARRRKNWVEAFPGLVIGRLDSVPESTGTIWVLVPPGMGAADVLRVLTPTRHGRPVVVLADQPSEDGALEALGAGASGYCNGHAATDVLLQVAGVVGNGGLWIGQSLMQRFLTATARLLQAVPETQAGTLWRERLTEREQEVARLLATGASNKEIARQLDITERTAKAHISAMLEKLGARDRLQLSLILNGIDLAR
jgi:DNA-binding NarL/FixJ family response regulator